MIRVNGIAVEAAGGADERLAAVRELLRQEALATGLLERGEAGEAIDAAIERLLETEVDVPEATREECRRFYAAHAGQFRSGDLVCARHILFAVVPGVPIEPLRAKAEEVLAELRAHPERFAERARALSNCPSGEDGGNLGQLSKGDCVPEFDAVLFATGPLGIQPQLARTRYGFHIVAVDRRIEGAQVPFEAVESQVAAHLARRAAEKALQQFVRILAGRSEIEGVDLDGTPTALVQ